MTKQQIDKVKDLISEALLMVVLDGVNPVEVERKLYAALKPYLKR